MAPDGNGSRIVRSYSVPNAPTGEGTVYVDEHGRHWRRDISWPYVSDTEPMTGVQRADLVNGVVVPKGHGGRR